MASMQLLLKSASDPPVPRLLQRQLVDLALHNDNLFLPLNVIPGVEYLQYEPNQSGQN